MDITVPKAVALINSLVGGFDFTTVGDHARAMAAFFAPAFRFGRFFARVPIDVAERISPRAARPTGSRWWRRCTVRSPRSSPSATEAS